MKKPVKIRYEQQPRKGAATFTGMVYFDDGTKAPIGDVLGQLAGLDLPIEHDGLPAPQSAGVVSFPVNPASTQPPLIKITPKPPQPLWPLIPKKP